MNNKEYFVSKLSFREDEKLIRDTCVYEYDGKNLSNLGSKERPWLVSMVGKGYTISSLLRISNGNWKRGAEFSYVNSLFSWNPILPQNSTCHKTFVSYYHDDDQEYRTKFENLFNDLIVCKSVQKDDIDSDNSDEYIKQLIQKDYLADTTVLVVLIGPNTKHRKHIDWEISGALNHKVGDGYAGLIGILLPTHPDYGKTTYNSNNLPKRLAANVESGYAKLYNWTEDRKIMQERIEDAFERRSESDKIKNKSIPQMQKNTN